MGKRYSLFLISDEGDNHYITQDDNKNDLESAAIEIVMIFSTLDINFTYQIIDQEALDD